MVIPLPAGTSYKFRVVAVNVIGSSPPSAPSKAYTVVGGRTHERPVDGPYITYNEAINETTVILKWTVSGRKEKRNTPPPTPQKKNNVVFIVMLKSFVFPSSLPPTVHCSKQHPHLRFLHLLPADGQR